MAYYAKNQRITLLNDWFSVGPNAGVSSMLSIFSVVQSLALAPLGLILQSLQGHRGATTSNPFCAAELADVVRNSNAD